MQGRYITDKKGCSRPILSFIPEGFILWSSMALIPTEATWFLWREIHRVKVYCDHCRSYYPNSSRIPHPYNDNIRVQIVRNYIIYYIAALAESKVAFIQNSLKIRSPNSSVGTNPSTVKLLRAILLSRTCVPKFISMICTGHSQPYEHCFVELDASWI